MRRVDRATPGLSRPVRSRRTAQRALGAVCATLALLGAAACGQRAGPAADGAEHVLIAGHQLAADTSFDEGLHEFADLVAEGSDGRVRVEVYPSAQLGSETALFENMRNGLVDLAVVSPGFIAEFVPEMSILSMPFLVTATRWFARVQFGLTGQPGSNFAHPPAD